MATKKVKNCCQFSSYQDKLLIECIKSYPALYDTTQNEHKSKIVRDLMWQEIEKNVQRSAADCKTRWRTLRDLYKRKIRENRKKTGSPTGNSIPCWKYMELMSSLNWVHNDKKFLPDSSDNVQSVVRSEKNQMEINESEVIKYSTQEEQPNGFPKESLTGQIIEIIEKESEETMDLIKQIIDPGKNKIYPIQVFFDNMAKMVIEFPPDLVVKAKCEVYKIVTNLEYDSLSY